jgi:hypothetical protein
VRSRAIVAIGLALIGSARGPCSARSAPLRSIPYSTDDRWRRCLSCSVWPVLGFEMAL